MWLTHNILVLWATSNNFSGSTLNYEGTPLILIVFFGPPDKFGGRPLHFGGPPYTKGILGDLS